MLDWFKKLMGLGPKVRQISAKEAQAKAKAGALILDVRTAQEYKQLQIPGAKNIPLDQLAKQWKSLPWDREIVCQCASGSRSQQAARFLQTQGMSVYNLSGGITAWQAAGFPTKKG